MKVVFSEQAKLALVEIGDYIARDPAQTLWQLPDILPDRRSPDFNHPNSTCRTGLHGITVSEALEFTTPVAQGRGDIC